MDKEWLTLAHQIAPAKNPDSYSNLLGLLNHIDSERGTRLNDEQANAIQKLITVLIDEIREHKNQKKN